MPEFLLVLCLPLTSSQASCQLFFQYTLNTDHKDCFVPSKVPHHQLVQEDVFLGSIWIQANLKWTVFFYEFSVEKLSLHLCWKPIAFHSAKLLNVGITLARVCLVCWWVLLLSLICRKWIIWYRHGFSGTSVCCRTRTAELNQLPER